MYAPRIASLGHAFIRRPLTQLRRDKVGEHFLLAYDENKRILAVCGSLGVRSKYFPVHQMRRYSQKFRQLENVLQLHTFEFDEAFETLQGRGTPVVLSGWYDSAVSIKQLEFVNGTEELLFVDDLCRARIFSLVTLQFRYVLPIGPISTSTKLVLWW